MSLALNETGKLLNLVETAVRCPMGLPILHDHVFDPNYSNFSPWN